MALVIPTAGTVTQQSSWPTFPSDPLNADQQTVLDLAWLKVEDGFDSLPGGPYLLDVTKKNFTAEKASLLFPYALAKVNYTIPNPPAPVFTLSDFPYKENHSLLAQALTLEIIQHLRRSYTEIPIPQGSGNITWLDRRDYEVRWKEIYDEEKEQFINMLRIFRRKFLRFGQGKGLVDSKQGRLVPIPMRVRVPRFMGYR